MSNISKVRPLFRTMLEGLNYVEHVSEFDAENIPSSVRDKSYHIKSGDLSGAPSNQQANVFIYPITLTIFSEGYRDTSSAIDGADVIRESIFTTILNPTNRLGVNIKNIEPTSSSIATIDESNDNSLVIEFNFECIIYECFN